MGPLLAASVSIINPDDVVRGALLALAGTAAVVEMGGAEGVSLEVHATNVSTTSRVEIGVFMMTFSLMEIFCGTAALFEFFAAATGAGRVASRCFRYLHWHPDSGAAAIAPEVA